MSLPTSFITSRTLQQSYGLAERLLREGNQMHMGVRKCLLAHRLCVSDGCDATRLSTTLVVMVGSRYEPCLA